MAETAEAVEEKQNQEQDAPQADSKTQAQSVEFSEAAETENAEAAASIDILLDMPVSITAAVGQTQIPIHRLLQLGPGSVLTMDKPIDAPADLYLKDTRFATGNVVIVDGHFAVRINQIFGLGNTTAGSDAE